MRAADRPQLGNVRDAGYDFKKIWFSKEAEEAGKFIRESKCFCTYECFLTVNILFNPAMLPSVFKEWAVLKARRYGRRLLGGRLDTGRVRGDAGRPARPGGAVRAPQRQQARGRTRRRPAVTDESRGLISLPVLDPVAAPRFARGVLPARRRGQRLSLIPARSRHRVPDRPGVGGRTPSHPNGPVEVGPPSHDREFKRWKTTPWTVPKNGTAASRPEASIPRLRMSVLVLLFSMALLPRITGLITFFNADEDWGASVRVLTGDLSGGTSQTLPLVNYLNAASFVPLYAVGRLVGVWHGAADFRAQYFQDPTPFIFAGRFVAACLGALTAVLAALIAGRLGLSRRSSLARSGPWSASTP